MHLAQFAFCSRALLMQYYLCNMYFVHHAFYYVYFNLCLFHSWAYTYSVLACLIRPILCNIHKVFYLVVNVNGRVFNDHIMHLAHLALFCSRALLIVQLCILSITLFAIYIFTYVYFTVIRILFLPA
jgi:hypothetical protein